MNLKMLKAIMAIVIIFMCVLITTCSGCDIVQQRERGISYHLGKVEGDVIQPGLVWHAPFVTSIKCYSIAPKTFEVTFSVGNDGAITKDLQTVGTTVNVKYAYDEQRIKEIALFYGDSVIESAMNTKILSSTKAVVGNYTIYELIEKQTEVTGKIREKIIAELNSYPIVISTIDITNWNWSEDFDRQIKETAQRTQQVKTAQQEAEIAGAQAQKQIKEAEARKQAAELDAQAEIARANGDAEAKKIKADAQAYENQKIAQNLSVMQAQWKYEIDLEKAKRWNGKEVSDQSIA